MCRDSEYRKFRLCGDGPREGVLLVTFKVAPCTLLILMISRAVITYTYVPCQCIEIPAPQTMYHVQVVYTIYLCHLMQVGLAVASALPQAGSLWY
ncbi:hypothetical protein BC629DRAFT_802573 [Irpex lacteus]|nr:hypothetical protein BC629DRAFT_802573 [Irpex lacteus]